MHISKVISLIDYYKIMTIAAFVNAIACSVAIAILLYYQPPLWILLTFMFTVMYITFTTLVVRLHLKLKDYKHYVHDSHDQKS